ncbi:MAG: EamA family transporter [Rhodocyclales bacterium]|nr:EamA family transporter [Rhodocyclales bacterium]
MSATALFFWILNAVLDTAGHLALKSVAITEHDTEWRRWKAMLSMPVMWLGLGCFVFEFFAWLALLSLIPLSLAVLIGSINIVVVMLAGKLLFDERLDRMRVAGMWLISMGVAMAGGFAGVGA